MNSVWHHGWIQKFEKWSAEDATDAARIGRLHLGSDCWGLPVPEAGKTPFSPLSTTPPLQCRHISSTLTFPFPSPAGFAQGLPLGKENAGGGKGGGGGEEICHCCYCPQLPWGGSGRGSPGLLLPCSCPGHLQVAVQCAEFGWGLVMDGSSFQVTPVPCLIPAGCFLVSWPRAGTGRRNCPMLLPA